MSHAEENFSAFQQSSCLYLVFSTEPIYDHPFGLIPCPFLRPFLTTRYDHFTLFCLHSAFFSRCALGLPLAPRSNRALFAGSLLAQLLHILQSRSIERHIIPRTHLFPKE